MINQKLSNYDSNYFKHCSNDPETIPKVRKINPTFLTSNLLQTTNRIEILLESHRARFQEIACLFHAPIIRSKTDPTCLNRVEKDRSGQSRHETGGTGWKKPSMVFHGLEGGPRKNLRIFANACPHWILFVVRKHDGRATALLCGGVAGQPVRYVHSDCLVNKWYV